MKRKIIILSMLLAMLVAVFAFKNVPKPTVKAFDQGEHLSYSVNYSLYFDVSVANLDLYVEKDLKDFAGQDCIHLRAVGKTHRFYDYFFKVRDYFDAYVDAKEFTPKFFRRDVQEGGYKKTDYYVFFPESNKVKDDKKKEYEIPSNTWDILSVLYLARKFDYSTMEIGDSIMMYTFIDKKSYPIGLRYLGDDIIKVEKGKFKCHIIKPLLIAGELFESEDEMTIWVSADKNHIPIKVESGISVGSVVAELKDHTGLKHPLTSLQID